MSWDFINHCEAKVLSVFPLSLQVHSPLNSDLFLVCRLQQWALLQLCVCLCSILIFQWGALPDGWREGGQAHVTRVPLLLVQGPVSVLHEAFFQMLTVLFLPFKTSQGITPTITSLFTLHYHLGVVNSPCTKFPQTIPVWISHLLSPGFWLIQRTLKGGRAVFKEIIGETSHIFYHWLLCETVITNPF